jgi:hypothetical protein
MMSPSDLLKRTWHLIRGFVVENAKAPLLRSSLVIFVVVQRRCPVITVCTPAAKDAPPSWPSRFLLCRLLALSPSFLQGNIVWTSDWSHPVDLTGPPRDAVIRSNVPQKGE